MSVKSQLFHQQLDGGGIYKSLDKGSSWENISRSSTYQAQNIIDPYVNDVEVDPDSPNTVYAATGYLGEGSLYRSLDGGQNWNSDNPEEWMGLINISSSISKIICDDSNSQYVWIGTQGRSAMISEDGETFKHGGKSSDPQPGPGNVGNGDVTTPQTSLTTKTELWTLTYLEPSASASVPQADSDNTGDGTMSNIETNSSSTKTETWLVTYAVSTNSLNADGGNTGDGSVSNLQVTQPNQVNESWILNCIDNSYNFFFALSS